MARSRMIRPGFWSDAKLGQLSRDARLLYVGFWTASDDFGNVIGHSAWLKSQIFPFDDVTLKTFEKWVIELKELGIIVPYLFNGEQYYHIPNFLKHQKIHKPSSDKNPDFHGRSADGPLPICGLSATNINRSKEKLSKENIYRSIVDHLNFLTGKNYRATTPKTKELIQARLNEGFTAEDFHTVHANKVQDWAGDSEMEKFLRPQTLYGTKFEGYLNERPKRPVDRLPKQVRENLSNTATWLKQHGVTDDGERQGRVCADAEQAGPGIQGRITAGEAGDILDGSQEIPSDVSVEGACEDG